MCLEVLLFFQNETPFCGTIMIITTTRLQPACPVTANGSPLLSIPISQRRRLRLKADGHRSQITQMVLSNGLELRLKPWTLEPANWLSPASQGATEMFGRSDLVSAEGCEGFSVF